MRPSRSVVAAGCYWCGRRFQMRQTGGHAQRFCTALCRLAFHAAARRWTVDAIEAGVLGIDDIRKAIQPTCTLLHTASAPAPMPTSIPAAPDAPLPHMPTDHHLALSSPIATPIIDQIVERIEADDRTASQVMQKIDGPEWQVKRDNAASTPQPDGRGCAAAQRLALEWGGDHEFRTYYETAAAKMLAHRLGNHVAKFLALVEKTSAENVMDRLRSATTASAAAMVQDDFVNIDEPPLPFMRPPVERIARGRLHTAATVCAIGGIEGSALTPRHQTKRFNKRARCRKCYRR